MSLPPRAKIFPSFFKNVAADASGAGAGGEGGERADEAKSGDSKPEVDEDKAFLTSLFVKYVEPMVRAKEGSDVNELSCVAMDEKGTTCADCYESLKACLGSTGANSEVSGLTSKKYHIERVYGGFGSQTRQRRGKGQKS